MADTQRNYAALVALLADNTSGDISPQDVRDVLRSILGGYGGVEMSGVSALTGIGLTPSKVTGWGAEMPDDGLTTGDLGNDVVYVEPDGDYLVGFWVRASSGTASEVFTFTVYVNGVATRITGTISFDSGGGNTGQVAAHGIVNVGSGVDVELRVAASLGTGRAITISGGQMWVRRIH